VADRVIVCGGAADGRVTVRAKVFCTVRQCGIVRKCGSVRQCSGVYDIQCAAACAVVCAGV
jgi:hypothetical protein